MDPLGGPREDADHGLVGRAGVGGEPRDAVAEVKRFATEAVHVRDIEPEGLSVMQ
jgi:hypothetical protein